MRRVVQIFLWFTFMSIVFLGYSKAQDQKYSGSGRKPPRSLSKRQISQLKKLLPLIPSSYDPYEIIAIGMVESGLTPIAVSHTGDYGLMQVNCRIHRKRLKAVFGFKNCEKDMLIVEKNMKASLHIIDLFRKYERCRGSKVYACYNGGQGWRFNQDRCLKKCSEKSRCRKCTGPARYADSVSRHVIFLKRKYTNLFNPRLSFVQ